MLGNPHATVQVLWPHTISPLWADGHQDTGVLFLQWTPSPPGLQSGPNLPLQPRLLTAFLFGSPHILSCLYPEFTTRAGIWGNDFHLSKPQFPHL